jgi:hypothetical protein
LENAAENLPVRKKPDELNIQFQCSDPASNLSRPQGTTVDIKRKPDVIISSRNALENAHDFAHSKRSTIGRDSPDFAQSPKKPSKLDWSVVLSCHEFKVHKTGVPEGLTEILETRSTKDIQLEEQDYEQPLQADDLATEPNEVQVHQASTSLKRKLSLDASDGGPPSKKVRNTPDVTPTGTPSGSRAPSGTGSARELEEERNKKAVLGRVQCASYALQMLSYSIGVHHAINILYSSTFFLFLSPFHSLTVALEFSRQFSMALVLRSSRDHTINWHQAFPRLSSFPPPAPHFSTIHAGGLGYHSHSQPESRQRS